MSANSLIVAYVILEALSSMTCPINSLDKIVHITSRLIHSCQYLFLRSRFVSGGELGPWRSFFSQLDDSGHLLEGDIIYFRVAFVQFS